MSIFDDITQLGNLLGLGPSLNAGAVNFSDPLNINSAIPGGLNFSALGGATASPTSTGLADSASSIGATAGATTANWLPALLQMLSVAYGATTAEDQMRIQSRIYDQLQENAGLQRQAALTSQNPVLMAQRAAAATQPLNARLVHDVIAGADLNSGLRGMAQAPGAVAAGEASALAPYVQSNLNTATSLVNPGGSPFSLPSIGSPQGGADYLSILNQLRGLNAPYNLPQGVSF